MTTNVTSSRAPLTDGARAAGQRQPFGHRPRAHGRACHSLVVRVPGALDVARLRHHLAVGAARTSVPVDPHLWVTPVPTGHTDVLARQRAHDEARRPIGPGRPPVRAVVLAYADGVADLVLVAVRSELPYPALRRLATLLLLGPSATETPALVAPRAPSAVPSTASAEWGLGDPRRAGTIGAVPFTAGAERRHLLGALALTLARYSQNGLVEIGTMARDGGPYRGPEDDGGFVHRVTVDEEQPLSRLLAECGAEPVPASGTPVVGVVFGDAEETAAYLPCLAPLFPLSLYLTPRPDGTLAGTCWYDEGGIAPEIAAQFCAHVTQFTASFAELPTPEPVSHVPFLAPDETRRVLALGGAGGPHSTSERIDHAFAAMARRRPDGVALEADGTELTYRRLDDRADRLAAGLRALGVAPGHRVGVCLDPGIALVPTLLAVLKAGCAYVPMDVRYPPERLRHIVGDAGLRVVVTTTEGFPDVDGVRTVTPDELLTARTDPAPGAACPVESTADARSDAYVIYTSGTTGRPKGVAVPHSAVGALVRATVEDFGLCPDDVWSLFHSSAFDFSVWEIWGCLLTGGRLVVAPYWVTRDPDEFHTLLATRRVTVLNQTPSAFGPLVRADLRSADRPAPELSVRLVVLGGETLPARVLAPWFARHSPSRCRVVNMYGITETTVHTTAHTMTPRDVLDDSRSVGRALPGWSVSVRDRSGRLLPPGPTGELWVAGAGLADRYLGQPDLTADRFGADPLTGERAYRSGDLGRLRPDGRIDHLGRSDHQVKLRGHRIEREEIRAVLLAAPSVHEAAVLVRQEIPGDPASSRIDAYGVLSGSADPRHVLAEAGRFLPDYMVPATFTPVPSMPLTANGKLDASRLPVPLSPIPAARPHSAEPTPADPQHPSPATTVAEDVLGIWSRLLKTDVGPDDNFFELGGNSLLVVRALSELQRRQLPKPSVREFYDHSTAAQFIRLVSDRRATT
ncbi:non-ribosomal peptide synthetase [Streptomyces sp. NPDC090106]|uniref:non-ribosomal peptide synthetase n=1 Tax=Streptomyces sp. NPDC090106 TaxID=3365946 RepID=UPI003819ECE7